MEADPGSGLVQRDLSVSLEKLGDVKSRSGDRGGALAAFEESLAIFRKLMKADPGNSQAQYDLTVSLTKVANIANNPAPLYTEALAILEAQEAAGSLSAEEQNWIGWVKERLAALPPAGKPQAAEQ